VEVSDDAPGEALQPETSEIPPLVAPTRSALDAWRARMIDAVSSGRAATTVARMATARAVAELRRLPPPDQTMAGATEAAEYTRRAIAAVTRAAHEIERNRYSLQAMQAELDRLESFLGRTAGSANGEADSGAGAPSADAGGGADERGSDGEIGARQDRTLESEDRAEGGV
jgi:hypothetical protein